jgi:EthD domain
MNTPLIVLNAFVIRADSQPAEGIRAARPRYNANRAGQGIEDPSTQDRTLALTAKPQLEWEAFDEYWRKVHGPKILHVDGPHDRQTELLTYYLQQHRVPSGPTSERAPPYSASPDPSGRLVTDPAQRWATYTRPAWDGLAQLGYRSKQDLEAFFDVGPGKYGDKIVPDEAVFIRGFGFHLAEEHVVLQRGQRRRDPIVLLKLHTRNAELTRPQFRGYWMAQHAELIRRLPAEQYGLKRYAQLVNVSVPGDKIYDAIGDRVDGVSAMSFADMNGLEDYLSSTDYQAIRDDEAAFARDTIFFTTINYVIRDLT